jgi:hypothetical protein
MEIKKEDILPSSEHYTAYMSEQILAKIDTLLCTSKAAKTKSRHILLAQYLQNFFNYYLVFMCR